MSAEILELTVIAAPEARPVAAETFDARIRQGGAYYQRLLQDFFVHHLMGVEPPDWNKTATVNGN